MIAIGWFVDVKWARFGDFGFWLHLFGAVTFWGALSWGSGDEFGKALYCALNVALIVFAIFIDRRIYAVLGTIGVAGYLGHLAFDLFDNVLVFTFALSAIGLAIIFAGIWLQRHMAAYSAPRSMQPCRRRCAPFVLARARA